MGDAARDAILKRVEQALKRHAPDPHWIAEPVGAGPVFPLPEPNEEARRTRFRDEFTAIHGEWSHVDSLEAGQTWLAEWMRAEGLSSLAAVESPTLRAALAGIDGVKWFDGSNRSTDGWDSFPVGVTPAESLVAESGTIVVGTGIAGRALSVLPPIHLVVATCDQLVGDLETSIRRIRTRYPDRLPSSFTWISGPSRTADIEKILVLGAHGPRRLVLLLLPAAASDHSTPA